MLRTRTVGLACAALFLTTAALFAVNVFVPLFLQVATGASPTEAGLLLVPTMLGITLSTNVAGRAIERTGRYKAFPIAGLALMSAALVDLAVAAEDPSRTTIAIGLAVFGLGFGVVGQVLTVAVQNDVDRRQLGTAMAATTFFRGLGGAIGAAALGAVFAARAGVTIPRGSGGRRQHRRRRADRVPRGRADRRRGARDRALPPGRPAAVLRSGRNDAPGRRRPAPAEPRRVVSLLAIERSQR